MPPTPQYVVAITLRFSRVLISMVLRLQGKRDTFACCGEVETSLHGTLPISYCGQSLRQHLKTAIWPSLYVGLWGCNLHWH